MAGGRAAAGRSPLHRRVGRGAARPPPRALFADDPDVHVLEGDWRVVLPPHAPVRSPLRRRRRARRTTRTPCSGSPRPARPSCWTTSPRTGTGRTSDASGGSGTRARPTTELGTGGNAWRWSRSCGASRQPEGASTVGRPRRRRAPRGGTRASATSAAPILPACRSSGRASGCRSRRPTRRARPSRRAPSRRAPRSPSHSPRSRRGSSCSRVRSDTAGDATATDGQRLFAEQNCGRPEAPRVARGPSRAS